MKRFEPEHVARLEIMPRCEVTGRIKPRFHRPRLFVLKKRRIHGGKRTRGQESSSESRQVSGKTDIRQAWRHP